MYRTWERIRRLVAEPASLAVSFKLDGKAIAGIPATGNRPPEPADRCRHRGDDLRGPRAAGPGSSSGSSASSTSTTRSWSGWPGSPTREARPRRSSATSWPWTAPSRARRSSGTATATSTAATGTAAEDPVRTGTAFSFAPTGAVPATVRSPTTASRFDGGGLSMAIGWPAQWSASFAGRRRGAGGRAGKDPPAAAAGRDHPHAAHDACCPGRAMPPTRREPLAALVSGPRPAPARRPADATALACAARTRARSSPPPPRRTRSGTSSNSSSAASAPTSGGSMPGGIPATTRRTKRRWSRHRHVGARSRALPQRAEAGLRPRAARHGADLLVWFEPERVRPGTQLDGSTRNGCSKAKDDEQPPAEPGQPGLPPMAHRPRVPADPGQRHQDLPAGFQLRAAGALAQERGPGPPGDEREPARAGLSAVLGRPAGAQSRACGSIRARAADGATTWRPCAAPCRCTIPTTATATIR